MSKDAEDVTFSGKAVAWLAARSLTHSLTRSLARSLARLTLVENAGSNYYFF